MFLKFDETENPMYFASKDECIDYIIDVYKNDIERNRPRFFALQKLNTNLDTIMKHYKER